MEARLRYHQRSSDRKLINDNVACRRAQSVFVMARTMIYVAALSMIVGCAAAATDCSVVSSSYSPSVNYFPSEAQVQTDMSADSSSEVCAFIPFCTTARPMR